MTSAKSKEDNLYTHKGHKDSCKVQKCRDKRCFGKSILKGRLLRKTEAKGGSKQSTQIKQREHPELEEAEQLQKERNPSDKHVHKNCFVIQPQAPPKNPEVE